MSKEKQKLDYMEIQTRPDIWSKILELNPINPDEVVFEPFAGENSLYNQIPNENKEWCEITKGRDIFDYDFENSNVTCIYTNPPYKADIPDRNGKKTFKNCVYYFLEMFMTRLKHLHTIGFLINAKSFVSLTPCRLTKLKKLGFEITNITILNTNYWYGTYFFVKFDRDVTDSPVKIIEKTFLKNNNII
jgi:hypothetical protein